MLALAASYGPASSIGFASAKKTIRVLPSSGPRTIKAAKTGCPTKHDKSQFTLNVQVTGIKRLVPVPTRKAIPNEGVVEAFHDDIPAVAYKRYSKRIPAPNFMAATPSKHIVLCASLSFFHTRAKHRVIVALGKTTGVLYKGVKPSSIKIRLK